MISWYSFFNAIALYSAAVAVVLALRRHTSYLKKHGVSGLLFVFSLAFVRILLPFDFFFSTVIESWTLLPAILDFLRAFPGSLDLLLALWGIGTAAVLGEDIFALFQAYKTCKGYTLVENKRIQQIAERLQVPCPVLVSPDVPVPYVAGVFRHTIYLPVLEKSSREIEMILRHEVQHIRSHDSVVKLLFGLLSAIFWWNPVVYKFRSDMDDLLELRCDAKVTARMDIADRGEYITMLLDMVKQAADPQPVQAWNAAVRPSSALQQRIEVLLDHLDAKPQRMSIAVRCCLIAAFLASYLVILKPAGLPPLGRGEYVTTSPTGIRMELLDTSEINRDTSFILVIKGKNYLMVNGRQIRKLRDSEMNRSPYNDLEVVKGYDS